MITKITGKLVDLSGQEATLEVGAFEYQVLVPEFVPFVELAVDPAKVATAAAPLAAAAMAHFAPR